MSRGPLQIRFGGLGGQGLVTLGAVLAQAGASAGLQVAASQAYGSQARGGATRSDVILSTEEIDFPHVHQPNLEVLLAQEAANLYLPELASDGVALIDPFFVRAKGTNTQTIHAIAATQTAIERIQNRVAANFVMLGALVSYTQVVEPEFIDAAMEELVNKRFLAINRQAVVIGYELGQQLVDQEGAPWGR